MGAEACQNELQPEPTVGFAGIGVAQVGCRLPMGRGCDGPCAGGCTRSGCWAELRRGLVELGFFQAFAGIALPNEASAALN